MKKLFLIIIVCLVSVFSYAGNDAVSLVSFEQNWLDNKSTLALKNNTNETIYNVQYVIEYLDMKGIQMDYAEFSSDVVIEPGMTKKVNISAYECDRHYSYYQSEAMSSEPHKFKVNFILKSYNQDNVAETNDEFNTNKEGYGVYAIAAGIVIFLLILGIVIGGYILVAVVANKNNRNVILWVLLSFIASPLLILIILVCIGKDRSGEMS